MRDLNSVDNPVPARLLSSHLFLLVGTNPLPAWVAARLLLRPGGQIYLVHSPALRPLAERLVRRLQEQGFRQPQYIPVAPYNAQVIFAEVARYVSDIKEGLVGLNYTGGTKVMATHAYRAIERKLPHGVDGPIFSYLDAEELTMRFDHSSYLPYGAEPVPVGRARQATLSIKELFELQEEQPRLEGAEREPLAPMVTQAIARLHHTPGGQAEWFNAARDLERAGKELPDQPIAEWQWPVAAASVRDALIGDDATTVTWKEVAAKGWASTGDLFSWMRGRWLESYVLDMVIRNASDLGLNDYARNMHCYFEDFDIEADVAAMRGYQLLFISCYMGRNTDDATLKLIEGVIRARQLGGDEAGAALVCMSPTPKAIENDVRLAVRERRVRVFGQAHIARLETELVDWLRQEATS